MPGIPKMFLVFFEYILSKMIENVNDVQTLPKMTEAIRKSSEYPEFQRLFLTLFSNIF